MWPFPNKRFIEVVDRQLAIFANDHADLISQARSALANYASEPDPRSAQDHYADHDELAEQVEEHLDDMYRHFAATLDTDAARLYRKTFAKRAKRAYKDLLPRLTFDSKEDQLPE